MVIAIALGLIALCLIALIPTVAVLLADTATARKAGVVVDKSARLPGLPCSCWRKLFV